MLFSRLTRPGTLLVPGFENMMKWTWKHPRIEWVSTTYGRVLSKDSDRKASESGVETNLDMDTPPPGSPPLGPGNASPVPGIAALEAGVASLAVNASAPATPPISDSDDSDSEQAPAALASLVAQSDEERADAGDSDARDGPVAGDAEVTDGPDSSEGEEDNAESEPENEKENENENEKDYEAEEITESAPASPLGPHKKKKCPHLKAGVKITKVKRLLHAKLKKGLACHVSTFHMSNWR